MNSKLASVENLWQVKDQVKKVEEIAEEVLNLKNQVLALNKQKDQARVAWRALQKSDEQNVWLNFGRWVKIPAFLTCFLRRAIYRVQQRRRARSAQIGHEKYRSEHF